MRVAALTMSYNEPVWAGVWGHGDDLGQKRGGRENSDRSLSGLSA